MNNQPKDIGETARTEFEIMYNAEKEKFNFKLQEYTELNGMKQHIEKSYSKKAIMDIIRRNYGNLEKVNIQTDKGGYTKKIAFQDAVFNIKDNGKYVLEAAIQREIARN